MYQASLYPSSRVGCPCVPCWVSMCPLPCVPMCPTCWVSMCPPFLAAHSHIPVERPFARDPRVTTPKNSICCRPLR